MIVAIGDIHGEFYSYQNLIYKIEKNFKIEKIILIGDLIDRGDYSKSVIDFSIDLSKDFELILILGNHEDMMLDYIFKENRYGENTWFENGGFETIRSFSEVLYNNIYFGLEDIRDEMKLIYENEIKFLSNAKLYHEERLNNSILFFSHAGIEFLNVSPYEQLKMVRDNFEKNIKHPYIWSRVVDNFQKKIDNFIFIHGHTPVFYLEKGIKDKPYINKTEDGELISINIDTGCVYGGTLTAMILDNNGEFEFILE